jgi:tetratricopeptide (TPR) repeat protein
MIADQRAREMGRDGNQLTNGTQHLDRAYSYEDEGEFEQALEECDKVIATARFPLVADAYNLRGIILEELGRSEEAVEAYTKAVAIMPGFREAADNLHELGQELSAYCDLVAIATFCDPSDALEVLSQ